MNTFPTFFHIVLFSFSACYVIQEFVRKVSIITYLGFMWYKRAWPEVDCSDDVGNREEEDGLITFIRLLVKCVAEVILRCYETG